MGGNNSKKVDPSKPPPVSPFNTISSIRQARSSLPQSGIITPASGSIISKPSPQQPLATQTKPSAPSLSSSVSASTTSKVVLGSRSGGFDAQLNAQLNAQNNVKICPNEPYPHALSLHEITRPLTIAHCGSLVKITETFSRDFLIEKRYYHYFIVCNKQTFYKLQDELTVRIRFDKETNIVKITGDSNFSVSECHNKLKKLLDEILNENDCEEKFYVWSYLRGDIIGKNGFLIKKIQQETNVVIRICGFDRDFALICLSGKPPDVFNARQKLKKYDLKNKDNFITERFSMNLIDQRQLLYTKKLHNVNFRSANDPDEPEMVCVIGQKANVYAFITALVSFVGDANLNDNTPETDESCRNDQSSQDPNPLSDLQRYTKSKDFRRDNQLEQENIESSCKEIRVNNLPFDIAEYELNDLFSKFGTIENNGITVKRTNQAKYKTCFGFISFVDKTSAQKVLTLKRRLVIPRGNDAAYVLKVKPSHKSLNDFNSKHKPELIRETFPENEENLSQAVCINDNNKSCPATNVSYSILVTNIPKMKRSLTNFPEFGPLNEPSVKMLTKSAKKPFYRAFVNFLSARTVEKILANDQPISVGGTVLKILARFQKETTDDTFKKQADCDKISPNFIIKATNLSPKMTHFEVFNIFKRFGTVLDPPGIKYSRSTKEALIPYSTDDEVQKLITNCNGSMIIFNRSVRICRELFPSLSTSITANQQKPSAIVKNDVKKRKLAAESYSSFLDENTFTGNNLSDEEFHEWSTFVELAKSKMDCGILVRNINGLTSKEILKLYFTNSRRSGGGKIFAQLIQTKFNRAFFVFVNVDCVEKIVHKLYGHEIEDQILYVSKLPPFRRDGFFLRNVPRWITTSRLKHYLEAKTRLTVDLHFETNGNGALVNLSADVGDLILLEKKMKESPLKECADHEIGSDEMKISPILHSNAVIVRGISSEDVLKKTINQNLKQHFPSQNDFVRGFIVNKENSSMMIVMKDHEFVRCLVKMSSLENDVIPFYDEIGWAPKNGAAGFVREYSNTEINFQLSDVQTSILLSDLGKSLIQQELDRKKCQCFWKLDSVTKILVVFASTMILGQSIVDFILSTMKIKSFGMDDAMIKVWDEKEEELKISLRNEFDSSYHLEFDQNSSALKLSTFEENAEKATKIVVEFFESNAKYAKKILGPSREADYIRKFCLENLVKTFQNDVQIELLKDGHMEVYGTQSNRMKLIDDVSKIKASLKDSEFSVTSVALANYFRSDAGIHELNLISDQTKTMLTPFRRCQNHSSNSIESTKNDSHLTANSDKITSKNLDNLNQSLSFKKKDFVEKNLVKIWLIIGDIVDEKSDVIVNGVGSNINRSGILCQTILTFAGPSVKAELNRSCPRGVVKADQKLIVSSSGNLHCKRIFHVVCPLWSPSTSLENLHRRILSCLDWTVKFNHTSISFPALGTGGRQYPSHVVAKILFASVLKWSQKNKTKKLKVNFVVHPQNSSCIREFESLLKSHIETEQESLSEIEETERFTDAIFKDCCQNIYSDEILKEFRRMSDNQSVILIYGPVQNIQDARKKLRDLVARKCDTVVFSHQIICRLQKEYVSALEEKAQIYNVSLSFDFKENMATVQGFYAKQFRDKLLDLFERLSELLFVSTNIVSRWYYRQRSSESWKKFIQIDNDLLEKGFKEKKFQVSTTLSRWQSVEVYFDSMTLMSNGNLKTPELLLLVQSWCEPIVKIFTAQHWSYQRVSLKRKDANDVTPIEWDLDEKSNDDYRLVTVNTDSEEFTNVFRTMKVENSLKKITKIERIENPMKYRQYWIQKEKVKKSLPIGFETEKTLFYCGGEYETADVSKICRNGFDRSVTEHSGYNCYGQGCHFFRDFIFRNQNGVGLAFIVKVLTGEFTSGSSVMKMAPTKNNSDGSTKQYDSVVDDFYDPKIFVVFSDNHSYPAYAVHYQN